MMNPIEMASTKEHVIAVLNSIPEYVNLFKQSFPNDPDPVTVDNAAKAIAAFERKLVTPARWDKFLSGDQSALTDEEKGGFLKFSEAGCPTCHNGVYVGGQSFQKLGIAKAWKDANDPGREKVTHKGGDKLYFKVPSLRNITKTGPYFHNGKVSNIDDAVKLMSEHQLGRPLSAADIHSIVTWLNTLTGDIPQDYVREPKLPPSTEKTPKPQT
jgi:cytochrome c peroxidase